MSGATTIYSDGSLTLSGAASTLELGGTFTDEGTFDWQAGGVTLNGASATWNYGSSDFSVGNNTTQSFTLKNGADMSHSGWGQYVFIGHNSGSNGTATVTGWLDLDVRV